jgi:hypothetical protein
VDNSENSDSGIAELWNCGLVAEWYTEKIAVAESQITKFLKDADQREAQALFVNSGPAEADYGKNSGCQPLLKRTV